MNWRSGSKGASGAASIQKSTFPCAPKYSTPRRYFNRSICYCITRITGTSLSVVHYYRLCPPSVRMVPPIGWEFVTSVFRKIRKKIANFTKFLKFVKIRFITSLVTAKSSNSHNTSYSSAVDYTEATVEWEQWADGDSDTERHWNCRRFVDFVKDFSWSCWTVDELTNVDLLTSQKF